MGKSTKQRRRISFAGVCEETGRDDELLDSIDVNIEDIGSVVIRIEYPWNPRCAQSVTSLGMVK